MMHGILGLEKTKSMQDNSVQAPTHSSSVSSDSSEAENDLYENPEEIKTYKVPQTQCKRWMADRNRTPKESQVRASLCSADKPSLRKSTGKVGGLNKQRHNKRWKRSTKVGSKKNADLNTATELKFKDNGQEFKEEPQWYTEPLSDNVISNNLKSKLETAYKSSLPSFDADLLEKLPASIRDLCIDDNCPTDYLWTGAFVDGHFVDIPALLDKREFTEILDCSKTNSDSLALQKSVDLFCEGDINQSMVDSCAFNLKQDSGILNLVESKNEDLTQFEGECSVILDGLPLNIWEDGPAGGMEALSSPSGTSCTNQLSSDQVKLWLSSTSGSTLIGKTGTQPFCKEPTLLSDKVDGWQDQSEASEKDAYFSVIKDQNDTVFSSGETTNWKNNPHDESVSLEPSQSSMLIATKDDGSIENKSSFSNIFREDCSSWSVLCKSGNLMPPFTLRNIDSVTFPIELNVNMATGIPTACSEDDLLSLLPGSEYLQLDDSFLIELPVLASKEKVGITKHSVQADAIEAGKWNPIFGICQESLSEKKDDLNSRVIEEIWKATPEEDETTFSEDGMKNPKCHSCSLATEIPMKQAVLAKLQNCPLQKSESNFWEDKLGKSQMLDSMDIDMTKHGSEWKIGSEQTDVSVTGGIEHLMTLGKKKESEFSPSKNTLLKTASTHSTLESSSFIADPKSLIKAHLQQNVHVEEIEEQSIINEISIDLPEDLWGNLTDYLNDSTEPRECSFLPFELSCPVPQMLTITSSLDSNTGKMNQSARTIPKLSSDLIMPHGDKLESSVHQDCMTMSAQTNIYPTSEQLFTKEVVLTRLEDVPVQKSECNFCKDQQGSSEIMSGSSNSTPSKDKSECHRVPKTNLKQDVQILQRMEFESKTCKETGLDKSNLISQDADEDKLSFLLSEFQDPCLEHDHSKMPQQTADCKVCASNTKKKEENDQQQLEKGKASKDGDELELCKESCPFSLRDSEVLLSKAESPEDCPKETCCLLFDSHLSSKNTDFPGADSVDTSWHRAMNRQKLPR
uniref:uncharacterized protein KIAA0232-like isoform X2 n=1 Tax=Pristiophorus japonicus TaxID=55135 RepID=UPI00398E5781